MALIIASKSLAVPIEPMVRYPGDIIRAIGPVIWKYGVRAPSDPKTLRKETL